MLKAILFDLDDTLLENSMETFMPAYFQALTRQVAHLISPDRLIHELIQSTQVMNANDGTGPTNAEAFAQAFYPAIGQDQETLEPIFRQFYRDTFPKLRSLTERRPEARLLVEWACQRNLQIAIATNPLFPRVAIEERLAWAGVPATQYDYALITSYENMHATKSHSAYYREIMSRLKRAPEECLMIGDSWEWDIVQAASVGIRGYWISEPGKVPPTDEIPLAGQGTLANLWAQVESERLTF